jgi:protein SCO1
METYVRSTLEAMHPRIRLALMAAGGLVLVTALLVALLASGSSQQSASGFDGALSPEMPAQDFTLRDQDGKTVRLSDERGKVSVLTFLYTTCRDTCPIVAQQIGIGLDRLGHDVPVLAVSVDPANDTPALAKKFLVQRMVQGRMRFLLGTRAQLAPIWHDYGIQPQGAGYEHSARVLLLDRGGHPRVTFPVDRLTPEGLAHDLRRLEAEPAAQ